MITQGQSIDAIQRKAEITNAKAEELYRAVWDAITRELSVGEPVDVEGLGKFITVRQSGQHRDEDGKDRIILPSIEPDFIPATSLVRAVAEAIMAKPELFAQAPEGGDDEDEPSKTSDGASVDVPEEKPKQAAQEAPLGKASHILYMDLAGVKVDRSILQLVPRQIAERYGAVPIKLLDGTLTVAMIDPEDFDTLQLLRRQTGHPISPALTSRDDIALVLDQYTGLQAELQELVDSADLGISDKELEAAEQEVAGEDIQEDAPTAKIVNQLLKRAVKEKASDIHIEPYEKKLVVRFRLDGVLVPRVELPKEIQAAIIARLKIISLLKIDEQRLPQDGRFSITMDDRQVDFRLSTIPVVFGEKVVMRILDKQSGIRQLVDVGVTDKGLKTLEKNIERSHGMVLVTGPTGSGKTTTLYAVLGRLMSPEVNVITLEDPVEYRIESINQSQVHSDIGYGFANGLRAVVRQDPDIVMLGEIRDKETAEMAVQAALTGHVVLSTLHTNDAAGAFPRLIDMGIEPFLLTSSIHTVIGQRLVRILDPEHRKVRELTKSEMQEVLDIIKTFPKETIETLTAEGIDLKHPKFYEPVIDLSAGIKGYKGRMGIFEVLDVTEDIRELIGKRASNATITQMAIEHNGMVTMMQDGIVKALRGQTSLEEVWRVTRE